MRDGGFDPGNLATVLKLTVLNRRVLPVLVAGLFAFTACSSGPSSTASPSASPSAPASASPSASPSPSVAPQTSLDSVKVASKGSAEPTLSFAKPFVIDKTRTKVLKAGNGITLSENSIATINYVGVDGRDAKVFDSSWKRKAAATFPLSGVIPGFKTGLSGQKVGSRVLIGIPGSEAYDSQGGQSAAGIQVGDTLLFVVDILDASRTEPSGKTVPSPVGLPTVTGNAASKPVVTIPSSPAPSTMAAVALIQGTGAKVAKGDTIYVRYVGYSWKTGKLIDDQFANPSEGLLSSTIPGWQSGLTGKQIGSRVLLVLPPKDGYPQGSNNPPLAAGDTIVYVVDLLYAYKA